MKVSLIVLALLGVDALKLKQTPSTDTATATATSPSTTDPSATDSATATDSASYNASATATDSASYDPSATATDSAGYDPSATATDSATASATTGEPHCPAPEYVVYDGPAATDGWHCESPPTPEQEAEDMA